MSEKNSKAQPTRWESSAKSKRRRITFQEKIAIRVTYDGLMAEGRKSRDDVLEGLSKEHDVSTRQIERYIEEVRDLPIEATYNLIRRWIQQINELVTPPKQVVKEMMAETENQFLEPWMKHVVLSPEIDVPIDSIKLENTQGIHCKVESDILFTRLRKHLDVRFWVDYERFTHNVLQYEFTCRGVFSKLVRSASQALEKLGCSTKTQITFAKTVFEETINPSSRFGYALRPPGNDDRSYGLKFGFDFIAISESATSLQYCRIIHEAMREEIRERFRQGFQPNQMWKDLEELKLDLVGQLEKLLKQFELARG